MFGIKELMGSIVDAVKGKRNYEIQDGGHYTLSNKVSAFRLNS